MHHNILCYINRASSFSAEKDKQVFEEKLSASSLALDNLHGHLKSLSSRLESSEENTRDRKSCLVCTCESSNSYLGLMLYY